MKWIGSLTYSVDDCSDPAILEAAETQTAAAAEQVSDEQVDSTADEQVDPTADSEDPPIDNSSDPDLVPLVDPVIIDVSVDYICFGETITITSDGEEGDEVQ